MNSVALVGRLTRDPELRETANGNKVANFTVAVDRPPTKGEEKQADFPRIVCFGKTAENVGHYLGKGRQVAIQGRIQTGSYTKQDGTKVYTTDVVADRVEFLGGKSEEGNGRSQYEGFHEWTDDSDDIPF